MKKSPAAHFSPGLPSCSCLRHPILQGAPTARHLADPRSAQGFLAGGQRAAAEWHPPAGRRRRCPYMLPTHGDARSADHRRHRCHTGGRGATHLGRGGAAHLGRGGAAGAGAGPHLSRSNPRRTRPGSPAAADAEPAVAPEPEPRPPPPAAGTSGAALGRAEVLASRWSRRAWCWGAQPRGSGLQDRDRESLSPVPRRGSGLAPRVSPAGRRTELAVAGRSAGEETEAGAGRPAALALGRGAATGRPASGVFKRKGRGFQSGAHHLS